MKQLAIVVSTAVLAGGVLLSCVPQSDHDSNHSDASTEKHALVIQADFAGLVMTGVAHSVSKDLDVYNVRPLIPLYDIRSASASLAYNAQTWPAGTVFVSVVDPGVGTARKSVVLKTRNDLFFVSPDNGSLSGPATSYGIEAVREIDESVNRIAGSEWAHTFHGRDVYSYTGARLAAGVISYEMVGPLLAPEVIMLDTLAGRLENGILYGSISGGTGRLGNIEISIDRQLFENLDPILGELYDIVITKHADIKWEGKIPYVKSFGDVSSGELSLAINQGNFAGKFGIGYGSEWNIEIEKHDAE